ncbi:MAG: AAA family ATPase [Anaerolineales bacterium]
MLIRFHVSNFLSFNEEVELSLIPGRVRQHPNHIVEMQTSCGLSLLRTALIYGANASGKSNLVKAMHFAQKLISEGARIKAAIPRIPFKLCADNASRPSKFEFEFEHKERCYVYGFEADNRRIHEEWLYEIKKTTEVMLFERTTTSEGETSVDFGKVKFSNKKEMEFLEFVAMGTRPNQLFLTESMEQNVKHFADIYQWFTEILVIIYPRSRFVPLAVMAVDDDFGEKMASYMKEFGTGILGPALITVEPDDEFPEEMVQDLKNTLQSDTKFISVSSGENYLVSRSNGDLDVKKLIFQHRMTDCEENVTFDITEESDGTRRLLDLLPALANLTNKDRVIVIDELDRSLHPQLSYKMLELFLEDSTSHSQVIATTHEENLLDLDLLRRDEIWFVEKDPRGASHLYSLEEFNPRSDKDVEKGYLVGRYGAIPVFGNFSFAQE